MRRIAIALSVALCASALFAQKVDTWSKTYGGTWVERIRSLDVMHSGDLLVFTDQDGPTITEQP